MYDLSSDFETVSASTQRSIIEDVEKQISKGNPTGEFFYGNSNIKYHKFNEKISVTIGHWK